MEVIGKSTVKDIEVKGNIEVAGNSTVQKLTATEINTPVVKNGDYKALYYREGSIAFYSTHLLNITIEVFISGVNKKVILKGSYTETENKQLSDADFYSKDVAMPFVFDKITDSIFKPSAEAIFLVSSSTSDVKSKTFVGQIKDIDSGFKKITFIDDDIENSFDFVSEPFNKSYLVDVLVFYNKNNSIAKYEIQNNLKTI